MKRNIFFGAVMMILCSLFIGCSKDDETDGGKVSNNYLKVKIDGREKTFTSVQTRWVDGGNYLSIMATDNGKETVMINVLSETSRVPAGQYTLDDATKFTLLATHNITENNKQINATATRNTVAPEDAFTLKIDKINNTSVEGSFKGTLVMVQGLTTLDKMELTDGEFKTDIQPN